MNIPTQMTAAGAFFLILFVTSASSTPVSRDIPDFVTCNANKTCPSGQYCLDGHCEMCVPCEIQHRQSPPPIDGISCAKEEAQCGLCFPGYEEQNLTGNRKMRKCSLIPTPSTSSTSFFVVSTTRASSDISDSAKCDAKTTCPTGEFCLDGLCEMCVPCEIRHRQSPSPINGISCARTEAECASCLPGYEEQSLIDGSQMRKCSPIPTSSISYEWIPWIIVIAWLFGLTFEEQLKNLVCKRNSQSTSAINFDSAGNLPRNGHSDSVPNGHPVPNSVEFSYQNQSVQVQHESQQN